MSGVIVSARKGLNKKLNVAIIMFVLVLIIASLAIVAVYGSNIGAGNQNVVGNGSSELYLYVAPNLDPSNIINKTLDDGTTLNFNKPGSYFNFSINTTIDIVAFIINHQRKNMVYSIIAYQAESDMINNSLNFTQLYYSPIEEIADNNARQVLIHVTPAYMSNNSHIGIALLDSPISNDSKILNTTDITARIVN